MLKMADFEYRIEIETSDGLTTLTGKRPVAEGVLNVILDLPAGKIKSACGTIKMPIKKNERIFMNGFQTWTYSPEYDVNGRTKGITKLPKLLVNRFHLDRYGDYHFVDYPYKKGITHGESYGYIRDGAYYRLFASLNEVPGYTLFKYDAKSETLTVERDCSGIVCGGAYPVFTLFFANGDENAVFDSWFSQMGITPITNREIKGYSSWYNRYEAISEKTILEDLSGCSKVLQPGDLFQVDDGWEPNVGDWLEADKKKFPNGMKSVAEAIHTAGFEAGLWLAPFVCRVGSKLAKKHPDWLYKVNGEPWINGSNWGGFYSLDIDNPEVTAYITETFNKVFNEWGFDLVKLDFLYGAAPFGNERETRAGRMIRAMRLLRSVCGSHPILGCGVPVMTAFGLVEYCRVSCDVGLDWNDKPFMRIIHRERVSTKQALETSIFRRQLNGRAYLSDPDVFFLRDDNIKLTEVQKKNLATANRLLGGVYLCSDNMGAYDEGKVEFYNKLRALNPVGRVSVDAENGLKLKYKDGDVQKVIDIYEK